VRFPPIFGYPEVVIAGPQARRSIDQLADGSGVAGVTMHLGRHVYENGVERHRNPAPPGDGELEEENVSGWMVEN
jgi:hypothetical protein